jgi:hypothetical protein
LLETLEPQPGLEETSADPLIKRYDDKKIENLVKNIKDTMNVRQEVSVACFYYSHFLLQSIKKILSLHWCISDCQAQGQAAQGQASTPKVNKLASGKQKVRTDPYFSVYKSIKINAIK